jgi:hypothetical protein
MSACGVLLLRCVNAILIQKLRTTGQNPIG